MYKLVNVNGVKVVKELDDELEVDEEELVEKVVEFKNVNEENVVMALVADPLVVEELELVEEDVELEEILVKEVVDSVEHVVALHPQVS